MAAPQIIVSMPGMAAISGSVFLAGVVASLLALNQRGEPPCGARYFGLEAPHIEFQLGNPLGVGFGGRGLRF
jgi:hypothetical protein